MASSKLLKNPAPAATAKRHVLIIEDNPDSRETLRMLLELWGHQVDVAEDGEKGVQMALAGKPETAVVDIGLPLMDGLQVARTVRAALHDDIRLIALTAYCQPEDRQRAFEAGFDHFMSKPADLGELARLLR